MSDGRSLVGAAQRRPNFAGTWALDKAKSEGLQGRMASVDQTWVVTQDAKTITVDKSFSGGEQPIPSQKSTYNLDGSETPRR